jgi:subtilisin family serine protease
VGLVGADVHARAAGTITDGAMDVAVVVIDEGVDVDHPGLSAAVRAEADYVDRSDTAMPADGDAHGTSCAGIIASRHPDVRGLAPNVALVAARIARNVAAPLVGGAGSARVWRVVSDIDVGDAIDWCWEDAGADVLSNSWGGSTGAPSDAITRAIGRARERGREGRGCVVVFAAGNNQERIGFPAAVPGVLAVGASNQWDERKTRASSDGDSRWGSNFGAALGLLAPGVAIRTLDNVSVAGYGDGPVTDDFAGTSAAAPHVAAAAALGLTVNPGLSESRVREILCQTADRIGTIGVPNERVGHGRLNAYAALRLARRG